ncbi:hypothetical protein P8452_08843 [Trifolium repens]|nr:hypothetical protein P8452_08843 [Trifolium repens]
MVSRLAICWGCWNHYFQLWCTQSRKLDYVRATIMALEVCKSRDLASTSSSCSNRIFVLLVRKILVHCN